MESEERAQGWRRDAARSAGALSAEVKRRRKAEADAAYWKALALALLRWPLW